MTVVGIDVAKASLAVALRTPTGRVRQKQCPNTPAGHAELLRWLRRQTDDAVHVGLEATGGYQDAVALALHDAGHTVSVLNPAALEAYSRSQLRRAKTDPTDAALIADYVRTQVPPGWSPPPPEMRQLQALVRRLDALLEMRTQERNRLEPAAAIVRPSIEATLTHLEAAITGIKAQIAAHIDQCPTLRKSRDLIVSIPGIGATTAAIILGELLQVTRFASARQLAAFSGLVPHVRHSGTSLRGRGTLSKLGAGRLRKALFFPALVAMRYNPVLRRLPLDSGLPASRRWSSSPRSCGSLSTRSTASSVQDVRTTPLTLDRQHGISSDLRLALRALLRGRVDAEISPPTRTSIAAGAQLPRIPPP